MPLIKVRGRLKSPLQVMRHDLSDDGANLGFLVQRGIQSGRPDLRPATSRSGLWATRI